MSKYGKRRQEDVWGILLVRVAMSHGLPVAVLAELGDDVIGSLVADPVYVLKNQMSNSEEYNFRRLFAIFILDMKNIRCSPSGFHI